MRYVRQGFLSFFLAVAMLVSALCASAQDTHKLWFFPVAVGDFNVMPDTTINSSFGIGLMNAVTNQKGVSLGALFNMNRQLRGVQISGITNISSGVEKGLQMAGAVNISAGYMRGLQLASYNYERFTNRTDKRGNESSTWRSDRIGKLHS